MKYLWIVFLLLAQCSYIRIGSLYTEIHDPNSNRWIELHQCFPPVFIGWDDTLGEEGRTALDDAIMYWNDVTNQKLFFNLGKLPFLISDVMQASIVPVSQNTTQWRCDTCLAVTHITMYKPGIMTGCIAGAHIEVKDNFLVLQPWQQNLTMRHELGHVLGLDDSDNRYSLMCKKLDDIKYNYELSESELQAIKRYY